MSSQSDKEYIRPHGGKLKIRYDPKRKEKVKLDKYPVLEMTRREWCDLQLLGIGALSSLEGFMNRKDYFSCLKEMHLGNGILWSIPITLSLKDEEYEKVRKTDVIYLSYQNKIWGEIWVDDIFKAEKEKEALLVYKTLSEEHPSVQYLKKIGSKYIGGKIWLYDIDNFGFPEFFFTPEQTRKIFKSRKWKKVVGFQTRNAPHRGHEYIQRCALEVCDGLFINPLVGETKSDDIPSDIIVRSYKVLVDNYYKKENVFLGVLPSAMRYGGPREAVHHAIIRKNFGCTHFIIGRDHAGFKNFYGPYDAQKIFDEIDPAEIEITPLFFGNSFWCKCCGGMTSEKACPHPSEDHISISGTQARAMLSDAQIPPEEFMRREISEILVQYYRTKQLKADLILNVKK